MKESYFFKTKEDITRYGISPIEIVEDWQVVPITEEEYNKAMAQIEEELKAEAEAERQKQEEEYDYYKQLEEENAALLFQLLTGEELNTNE